MVAPTYLYRNASTGLTTENTATESSAGVASANEIVALNAQGYIDPTMIQPTYVALVASEALAAGAMVNVWSNAGVPSIRNASAAAATPKPAMGYVSAAVASGATGDVFDAGTAPGASLTPGGRVYLSTTAGGITQTPVSGAGAGSLSQLLGIAVSATAFAFEPDDEIVLAS